MTLGVPTYLKVGDGNQSSKMLEVRGPLAHRVFLGGVDVLPSSRLDAGDVGGEEVDSVAVEVASGAVVVLGGPGVGMAGEDLGVAERNAGVEGVGDRRMTERVRADVTGIPAAFATRATIR